MGRLMTMAATKEELQERAQLVRMYEASCSIHFPTELDIRFRKSLMYKLASEYQLRKPKEPELPAATVKAVGKPF